MPTWWVVLVVTIKHQTMVALSMLIHADTEPVGSSNVLSRMIQLPTEIHHQGLVGVYQTPGGAVEVGNDKHHH